MDNIKSFFAVVSGAMLFMSVIMFLIDGKFEKKLLSMLAITFVFAAFIFTEHNISFDFGKEYDSMLSEAQKYADDIRLNIENSLNDGENNDE